MILQPVNSAGKSYIYDVKSGYFNHTMPLPQGTFLITKDFQHQLEQRNTYMQVENSFNLERRRQLINEKQLDTTIFYGEPDKKYRLDDYTRFLTMEEVLKEYVNEVAIKKQADNIFFRVKDKTMGVFFDNSPLILIDGVPVPDAGKLVKFDPLKISTIDVVSGRYFHGAQVYDGIVSFKTYEGDLAGFELNADAVVIEYDGIQKQQEFYNPNYETETQKNTRVPDFRNVLLWKPDINTSADGKASINFYTSGFSGRFLVYIQGISPAGLPVSAAHLITVKP
jgi:hypothetical protein